MMTHVWVTTLQILAVFLLFKNILSQKTSLVSNVINLEPGNPVLHTIPPNESIQLITSNIPLKNRFAVFQAHSQIHPLTISYTSDVKTHGTHFTSKNAGLVTLLQPGEQSSFVYLRSNAPEKIKILLRVALYTHSDPIPGGCNMEFDVETSPFLRVSYDAFITTVEFQPASLGYRRGEPQKSCDVSYRLMEYEFYVYHIVEGNLKEDDYFNAISIMADVNQIKAKALKVEPLFGMSRMTFTVTTYRRQGIVFNVIAKNKTDYAPYVPNISYGCSLIDDDDSCADLLLPFEWILAIFGGMLGMFLCFVGHRFFKSELFSFGFVTTAMIIYIFLIRWGSLGYPGTVAVTILVGIAGGFIWLLIWWISGSPLVAVLLPGFDLGFLCGSVLMFTPLGDAPLFQSDSNFWLLIACFVLLIPVLLISYTKFLNILSCTIIGSYAAVFLLDCFFDGSLRYIIINVIRRATIPNYNNVINISPYQTTDIMLTIFWILLIAVATFIQFHRERDRPPFPISEFRLRAMQRQERQQQRAPELDPLIPNPRNVQGYQSIVF